MYICKHCDKYYSTPYNLRVHRERIHAIKTPMNPAAAADEAAAEAAAAADNAIPRTLMTSMMENHAAALAPPLPLKLCRRAAVFAHPFTMCISSASKGGKTFFTNQLLRSDLIQPRPERILYVYKRWQPLYQDIKDRLPHVEFVQGVPTNIDNDDFFNTSSRNLIILDDQMSATSGSSHVSNLFTEGSHHRNLSVINLTQNLFPPGKHSTTQRRNTDYFILFKSPMGQDQVRILGRFMYPGRLREFLDVYQSATHPRYGYLVIDATQSTSENERLKTDIFSNRNGVEMGVTLPTADHVPCIELQHEDHPNGLTVVAKHQRQPMEVAQLNSINSEKIEKINQSEAGRQPNNIMANSCDECGILFDTIHDLQRHVRNSCPERGPPCKRTKLEVVESEEPNAEMAENKPNTEHEVAVFQQMYDEAADLNHDEEKRKIKKYIREGLSREEAEYKAANKMKLINMRSLISNYTSMVQNFIDLSKGIVHNEVMSRIKALTEKGFSDKQAVLVAIKQFESYIEGLLKSHEDDESDTESAYSDDSDTTDNSDSEESSDGEDDDEASDDEND